MVSTPLSSARVPAVRPSPGCNRSVTDSASAQATSGADQAESIVDRRRSMRATSSTSPPVETPSLLRRNGAHRANLIRVAGWPSLSASDPSSASHHPATGHLRWPGRRRAVGLGHSLGQLPLQSGSIREGDNGRRHHLKVTSNDLARWYPAADRWPCCSPGVRRYHGIEEGLGAPAGRDIEEGEGPRRTQRRPAGTPAPVLAGQQPVHRFLAKGSPGRRSAMLLVGHCGEQPVCCGTLPGGGFEEDTSMTAIPSSAASASCRATVCVSAPAVSSTIASAPATSLLDGLDQVSLLDWTGRAHFVTQRRRRAAATERKMVAQVAWP